MREFGKWLLILGLGSFILRFFNMEFKLLMWIDLWGYSAGNLIRLGVIVLGGAIFFLDGRNVEAKDTFEDISQPTK